MIERPAAYDAVEVNDAILRQVSQWTPTWCYYGTLFPSDTHARHVLQQLLDALPNASRFYDVNLRQGFESPALVTDLLRASHVVKLNERELADVHRWLELPADPEAFLPRRFGPVRLAGRMRDARRARLRSARGR